MAKAKKADAATSAYKIALAKVVENHKALKIALVADTLSTAALAQQATEQIEALGEDPEAKPN